MNLADPTKAPPREDGVVAITHVKLPLYADTYGELAQLAASQGLDVAGVIREALKIYAEASTPESARIKANDKARLREQRDA